MGTLAVNVAALGQPNRRLHPVVEWQQRMELPRGCVSSSRGGPLCWYGRAASNVLKCFNPIRPMLGSHGVAMRKLIFLAAAVALSAPAFALTTQQELMKSCNTTAQGKKDDERKKACLSDGKKAQQEKMKACNNDAAGKKGAERKAFMNQCLKDK